LDEQWRESWKEEVRRKRRKAAGKPLHLSPLTDHTRPRGSEALPTFQTISFNKKGV
jgi:hypothetical protein